MPTFHYYVVDRSGTHLADLTPKANVSSVANELNAAGGITLSLPITDALVNSVPKFSLIQAWRGTDLLKWAMVTQRRPNRQTMDLQCAGLWWPFHRRYVGRASRQNWLVNGNFETGDLTGWSTNGCTASVVSSHHSDGSYGAELIQASPGVDSSISQQFAARLDPQGTYYTFDAQVHIYADQPYLGPAFENRGLWVELIYPGNVVMATANAPIDESYLPGQTYRLKCGLTVPGDAPVGTVIEVRPMAIGGYEMVDSVYATIMESLSFGLTDVLTIAEQLVLHAQDTTFGKSDEAIGVAGTLSGLIQSRFFQFADHQEIAAIIEEMAHAGLFDFDIVHDALGTTSTFTGWSPTRGSYKPTMALTVTQNASDSCYDFDIPEDGEQTDDSVIVLGEGDGPDREEAGYIDASGLGGLILERIITANPGTPIDALGPLAAEAVRASMNGAVVGTFYAKPGSPLLLGLDVGDTTDATVTMGAGYSFSERVRVIRKEITPKSDVAAFTVNLAN